MPTEFSFEEAKQPAKSFTFEEATAPKSFSFEEAQTATATTPEPSLEIAPSRGPTIGTLPSNLYPPAAIEVNPKDPLVVPKFLGTMVEHAGAAALNIPEAMYREATGVIPKEAIIGEKTITQREAPLFFQPGKPAIEISKKTELQPEGDPISRIVEGFLTPGNIAAFPFAATKPVQAYFLAQTAPGAIDAASRLIDPKLPEDERKNAATDLLISGLMTVGISRSLVHGVTSEAKAIAPLTTAETSRTTEEQNARAITKPESVSEHEIRTRLGQETPLRQPRPASETQTEVLAPQTEKAVKEIVQPEDVSGSVLGKPAEVPSPQVHEEAAQSPSPPPAQPVGTEAGKAVDIKPGDKIKWEPNERERKYQGPVEGTVVDVISNTEGEKGYHVLVPLEGDPGNVVRVWDNRGKIVSHEPSQVEPPTVRTPESPSGEVGTGRTPTRAKTVVEIADEIAARGIDPQASYGQFVKARNLKPEISAKEWLPIYRKSLELAKLNKQIAITKRQSPTPEPPASQKPAKSPLALWGRKEGHGEGWMRLSRNTSNAEMQRWQKDGWEVLKYPADTNPTIEAAKPAPPAPTSEGKDLGPGLGAAKTGEVEVQGNPDIYGIANRVEAERAMALGVEPPPPGKGIAPADSVEHGRELLKQGRSAEGTLELFNKTKAVSSEDFAVVRAHGENLALAARRAEEKFGTDSDEYRAALKASTDWDARIQPMKTEWNKAGMAMQGETDIDTGSFTGLARAHKRNTGEDFTPKQTKKAKEVSGKVRGAAEKVEEAKQNLLKDIDERTSLTAAEKRALDAANKTVRENAIRVADAENKTRVATTELERETAKIQEAAARKALKDAEDVAKAAAIKLAKAETKAREQRAAERPEAIQNKAAQDALKAANQTVRKAAADLAKEENKARVAKTVAEKDLANVAVKRAKQRLKEEQKRVRQAAIAAAKAEVKNRVSPELKVWEQIRKYIDQGEFDFDEVRNRVATDLGMSVEQVTKLLTKTPRTKYLANEMWRRQQDYARFKESAKAWLRGVETPEYHKWIGSIPKVLFSLKVGFHGTVALGTHAPMVAFQPKFWKTYADNFLKMYHMVGSRAYHERQVQDLLRRKNYVTARRAGLVNDPSIFEDYNSPEVVKFLFTKLGDMGNRGYSILKILRQDMFDQMWDQLPQTTKTPEVAKAIADGLNHATGVVQVSAPKAAAVALFAPRLLGSRVMWLAGDPIRAADTMFRWKDATQAEKIFALNQVKEKLWVSGVMFTLLAINEGILNAVGSKQQVNFTDPFESDFLKFKVAGMNVSYGNAMITMARLPLQLWVGLENEGKFSKITYEDENTAKTLFKYARSQASPFMALMFDLAFGRDYQERPLPRAGFGLLEGKKNVPKRLAAHGMGEPYTWPEYWSEQLAPIPFQEAIKEVWKTGLGMSDEQMTQFAKAMVTIAVMGGTGARVSEDYSIIGTPSSKNKR